MATQSIPREEWRGFFDRLSSAHRGAHAVLELLSPEFGDQIIAGAQIFRGISADEKDGENAIAIMMGPHSRKAQPTR